MQSIEGKTKFNVNTEWTDISFLTFQPKANEPQDDIIKIDSLQNCVCSFKGKTYIAITQLILHICLRGALWGFQNGKQNKKSNCKNIRDQGSHVQKHWYKTTVVGSRSICLKLVIIFVLLMYDKWYSNIMKLNQNINYLYTFSESGSFLIFQNHEIHPSSSSMIFQFFESLMILCVYILSIKVKTLCLYCVTF